MKWSLLIGLFALTKAGVTGNYLKSIQSMHHSDIHIDVFVIFVMLY